MLKNGWRIGDYGDFDPGIYLVYNLEESEYADRWYGTYVMKFAIKTNNKFLIFDPDAAKIVYGENSDLRSQIELIDPKLLGNERVESYIVRKEKYGGASIYGFPPELKDSVNGIMINTGPKKDGYVAVIYKPENVLTMISWAKIPELYSVEKLPREKWKAAVRASQSGADELLLRLIEKYDGDVYKLKTNPPTQEELEAIAETIRYPEITEEDSLRALKEFYTYDYDLRDLDDLSLEELIWTIYQEEGTDWSGLSAMEIVEELIGYEPSLSEYIQTGKKSALRNIKRFLNIRDRGARDFEATTFDEYIEWMKKIGLDPQKRTDPYSRETLEWNREVDGIQLPQRIKLA